MSDICVGIGTPTFYDFKNCATSYISPSTTHVKNTAAQRYFARYLLQKAMSVFKWELPETWDKDYFLYVLYCWGYIAVINTDKFGVIPQGCGLKGYNVFYQPRQAVITNPLLQGMLEPVIDKDCVVLKLQPDFGGIMDIVNFYADNLALCAETLQTNLLNSKLAYVFTATDKASAESFKVIYDKVASGEPAVVFDKKLMRPDGTKAWEAFSQDIKSTYIASDVISDMRKLVEQFDTEVGIPNANTDKRERLISDEVNANNFETFSKCALWLDELKKGCKKINKMFGLNISVDWRKISGDDMKTEIEGGAVE